MFFFFEMLGNYALRQAAHILLKHLVYIQLLDSMEYGHFKKSGITWENDRNINIPSTPGRLDRNCIYIYT